MTDDADRLVGIEIDAEGVIALSGDLDLASIDPVRVAIGASPAPEVRVDVSQVEYMDSSGLSLLIAEHRRLEGEQRKLVLRDPSEPVRQLLRIAGLDEYLHVELVGA